MKPRMHNNARIFELRGNPWHDHPRPPHETREMTDIEAVAEAALKRHGFSGTRYAAEIRDKYRGKEDPDLDSFTKAGKAPVKPEFVPVVRKKPEVKDLLRRAAQLRYGVNQKAKPKFVQVGRAPPPAPVLDSRANERKSVRPFWVYYKTEDGQEYDLERGARKAADKSFDRLVKRKDVLTAEIWETATGECLKRWERRPEATERRRPEAAGKRRPK